MLNHTPSKHAVTVHHELDTYVLKRSDESIFGFNGYMTSNSEMTGYYLTWKGSLIEPKQTHNYGYLMEWGKRHLPDRLSMFQIAGDVARDVGALEKSLWLDVDGIMMGASLDSPSDEAGQANTEADALQ